MNSGILRSVVLFVIAGLCEIGGGYLVWMCLRDHRTTGRRGVRETSRDAHRTAGGECCQFREQVGCPALMLCLSPSFDVVLERRARCLGHALEVSVYPGQLGVRALEASRLSL